MRSVKLGGIFERNTGVEPAFQAWEARARDLRITNALLYQLSHIGIETHAFRCFVVQRYIIFLEKPNLFIIFF